MWIAGTLCKRFSLSLSPLHVSTVRHHQSFNPATSATTKPRFTSGQPDGDIKNKLRQILVDNGDLKRQVTTLAFHMTTMNSQLQGVAAKIADLTQHARTKSPKPHSSTSSNQPAYPDSQTNKTQDDPEAVP